jgi:hypothetical protein
VRLSGRTRKAVLLLHVLAAGSWFGLDVAMAVLVFTAVGTDSDATRGFTLQALGLLTVWPMLAAAVLSLVTGVVLGLGSKYGLVRYWWVLLKLALNLVLATLVVTALRVGVDDAVEAGRAYAAGLSEEWPARSLLFPPIVSPIALLVAFVLSFFKPWGRVRPTSSRSG